MFESVTGTWAALIAGSLAMGCAGAPSGWNLSTPAAATTAVTVDSRVDVDLGSRGKPLNVTMRRSGPTVSRTIGPSGGKVSLRSPQGRFRLVIPNRALTGQTRIRMYAAVPGKGWPLGPTAAVQLTPDGLQLFRPAKLTLVPRQPMPVARRAPLAWRGTGRDVHVYPPILGVKGMALSLSHFSGYSWVQASDGQLLRVYHRDPIQLPPELESQVSEVIVDSARHNVNPDSQEFKDRFAAQLVGAFELLAGRLAAAEAGKGWREAIRAAIAFDSLLTLYSEGGMLQFRPPNSSDPQVRARLEALRVAVQASFWRVYEKAYARAERTCIETGKEVYAREMLGIAKEMALLGREIPLDQVIADAMPCKAPQTLTATLTESWDTTIAGLLRYETHERITISATFTRVRGTAASAVYGLASGSWQASRNGFDSDYCSYSGSASGTQFQEDNWMLVGDSLMITVTPGGSYPVDYFCQDGRREVRENWPRPFDLVVPNDDFIAFALSGTYRWKEPGGKSATIDRTWNVVPSADR